MARYTLWDIPSSSLLVETDDESNVRDVVQSLADRNGVAILEELVLGVERPRVTLPENFSGSDIVRELKLSIQVVGEAR
jgi:hypothetical protein